MAPLHREEFEEVFHLPEQGLLSTAWILLRIKHRLDKHGGSRRLAICVPGLWQVVQARGTIRDHDTGSLRNLVRKTQQFILSEWAAGAEENAILEFQQALAEHEIQNLLSLSRLDLMAEVTQWVKTHSIPSHFEQTTLSPETVAYIDSENRKRISKKPWSYTHLNDGFKGSFVKYTTAAPILDSKDTKTFLAMIKVLCDRMK